MSFIEKQLKDLTTKLEKQEKRLAKLERLIKERPSRAKRPTAEMVDAYLQEHHPDMLPFGEKFVDYYEANGWKVGNTVMKSWEATVRNWVRRSKDRGEGLRPNVGTNQPSLGMSWG